MGEIYLKHIVGWRYWNISEDGFLMSVNYYDFPQNWPPREPRVAQCRCSYYVEELDGESPPHWNGMCGIYAFKDLQTAIQEYRNVPNTMLGKVALWGKTIHHSSGYRAQYAYPIALVGGVCSKCGELVSAEAMVLIDKSTEKSGVGLWFWIFVPLWIPLVLVFFLGLMSFEVLPRFIYKRFRGERKGIAEIWDAIFSPSQSSQNEQTKLRFQSRLQIHCIECEKSTEKKERSASIIDKIRSSYGIPFLPLKKGDSA